MSLGLRVRGVRSPRRASCQSCRPPLPSPRQPVVRQVGRTLERLAPEPAPVRADDPGLERARRVSRRVKTTAYITVISAIVYLLLRCSLRRATVAGHQSARPRSGVCRPLRRLEAADCEGRNLAVEERAGKRSNIAPGRGNSNTETRRRWPAGDAGVPARRRPLIKKSTELLEEIAPPSGLGP